MPDRSETAAQSAISGRTRTRRAAIWAWPLRRTVVRAGTGSRTASAGAGGRGRRRIGPWSSGSADLHSSDTRPLADRLPRSSRLWAIGSGLTRARPTRLTHTLESGSAGLAGHFGARRTRRRLTRRTPAGPFLHPERTVVPPQRTTACGLTTSRATATPSRSTKPSGRLQPSRRCHQARHAGYHRGSR
jgi:hypothetical protein